jgi:uncharacterized membrane protein
MEALLKEFAVGIALCAELAGIAIVAIGALEAFLGTMRTIVPSPNRHSRKKEVWRRFGTWLLLGLEFELAADIVRSAIAPTWMEIGQLGAVAVIRTFLNYFLEKDLEHAAASERAEAAAVDGGSAHLGAAA